MIDQLVKSYFQNETWIKNKLTPEEAWKYHEKLYSQGNIIVYQELGVMLGYVEFWRINYEQFGRIICQEPFSAYIENVKDGNIAYVANVWIEPKFRNTTIIKTLKLLFFKRNFDADYFVGEAIRKHTNLVKVFKKEELTSKLFKEGVPENGKK